MPPDVVPAKTEVVSVIRIYAKPQQFKFNAWTGEPSLGVLIISISQLPKDVVTVPVAVICNLARIVNFSEFLPNHYSR